jgi:iron complex outermembrane receptor protein
MHRCLPYALTSVCLAANADDMTDFYSLSLQELLTIKVQAATHSDRPLQVSPSSVTVYTREEILAMGINSLEQLLNFVPGVQTSRTDEGGRGYPASFRGRRNQGAARDVLVLIDGIRINDPVAGGTFNQSPEISLHNVAQVEIIRGPGSALYGANAFSGVINIISDTDVNEVELGGGDFGAREVRLQTTLPLGDDWQLDLSADYYRDDGEDYDAFYSFFGTFEPTSDSKRLEDWQVRLRGRGFDLNYRQSKRRYEDFIVVGAMANGDQRFKVENRSLRLSYEHQWGAATLHWHAETSEGDQDSLLGLFPESPEPPIDQASGLYWTNGSTQLMLGGNVRTVEHDRIGLDVLWPVGEDHQLLLGLEAREESVGLNPFQSSIDIELLRTTGRLEPAPSSNPIQEGFYLGGMRADLLTAQERDNWGLYLQDEWRINENWQLVSGLRHDHYDDFGSHTSFRGGLVWQPNRSDTWKLLYGGAFRAPSFLETRAGIASGGISNPDLDPETVDTLELSWARQWSRVNTSVTLYRNQYRDIIRQVVVEDVVTGITATQPQNTGDDSTNGAELEVTITPANAWLFKAGVSHLFTPLDNEQTAETTAFLVGNYQRGAWNANLSGFFHHEILSRPADATTPATFLDPYWHWNLALRYQLQAHLAVTVDVNNLFDKHYNTWSPQTGIDDGLPARGRSVILGLRFDWGG